MVDVEEWRTDAPPVNFDSKIGGAENLRTNASWRGYDESFESTEQRPESKTEAARSERRRDFASSERKVALVPKVTAQRRSSLGWEIMEGVVILTDRRVVFIPDEIGPNTSLVAAAGALGGMVGALLASMTAKRQSEDSRDMSRPLDDIVASSKRVLEVRYDEVCRLECKPSRRILSVTAVRKPELGKSKKVRLLLAMPAGFLAARTSEGMDRKQAWEQYCSRCRTAFESSVVGKGVEIIWKK